jgi:hypothetical protein
VHSIFDGHKKEIDGVRLELRPSNSAHFSNRTQNAAAIWRIGIAIKKQSQRGNLKPDIRW